MSIHTEDGPLPILAWARREHGFSDARINGLSNIEIMQLHEDYQEYVEVWHLVNDKP